LLEDIFWYYYDKVLYYGNLAFEFLQTNLILSAIYLSIAAGYLLLFTSIGDIYYFLGCEEY